MRMLQEEVMTKENPKPDGLREQLSSCPLSLLFSSLLSMTTRRKSSFEVRLHCTLFNNVLDYPPFFASPAVNLLSHSPCSTMFSFSSTSISLLLWRYSVREHYFLFSCDSLLKSLSASSFFLVCNLYCLLCVLQKGKLFSCFKEYGAEYLRTQRTGKEAARLMNLLWCRSFPRCSCRQESAAAVVLLSSSLLEFSLRVLLKDLGKEGRKWSSAPLMILLCFSTKSIGCLLSALTCIILWSSRFAESNRAWA